MTEQDEKLILLLIVKHGTAWEAYTQAKHELRILREYLGMEDEADD